MPAAIPQLLEFYQFHMTIRHPDVYRTGQCLTEVEIAGRAAGVAAVPNERAAGHSRLAPRAIVEVGAG